MKKIIMWCLCFLMLVALIPLASVIKGVETPITSDKTTTNANAEVTVSADEAGFSVPTSDLSEEEKEIILCKVMEHITEDATTEAKKALLAVCKNNYLFLKGKGTTDFETDISKYSDDFLNELSNLFEENDYTITYKGNRVAIPMTPQNGGFTATSDEYPYIRAVASPWDTFSKSYIRGAEYPCGVSIYGINYLCEEGLSWSEALAWYLPDFKIES